MQVKGLCGFLNVTYYATLWLGASVCIAIFPFRGCALDLA